MKLNEYIFKEMIKIQNARPADRSQMWPSGIYFTKNEVEKRFVHEVYPLLESKCFVCHGSNPDDIRGDLDLTNRQSMIDRQILTPSQAENSRL